MSIKEHKRGHSKKKEHHEEAIPSILATINATRYYLGVAKIMTKKLPPPHPGEILNEEFLKPLGMSQYRLAKDINVPPIRINEIVHGKRAISANTALRLARYFGNSADFWMNLQSHYDLAKEADELDRHWECEVKVLQLQPTM